MSFFFTKKDRKSAPKRIVATHVAPRKNSIQTLRRLGCAACPLNKADILTPKMVPTLAHHTDVYFLAEAPGKNEDEVSHAPLTGPSGSLLRQCIPSSSLAVSSFDNVCNCRPPGNRTPVWQEIESCQPRRVKFIEQAKPKLIVGLGAVPLQAMLGSSDLSGMRGRLFAVKIGNHECWFMPTYHPSFILRTAYDKKKPLHSKLGHCFRLDIHRALRCAQELEKPPHIDSEIEVKSGVQCFDGSDPSHYGKLCALLDHAGKADTIAIEIETKGLRPFSEGAAIMSVSVATDQDCFSFAVDHPGALWSIPQRGVLKSVFGRLLANERVVKVAHNSPFEIEWFIWWYTKKIVSHVSWECTQLQAHLLDERRGKQGHGEDERRAPYQNLKFLVKQHFGIEYKSLFKKLNKKDMSKSDLGEMLIYNALDTKYTLKLYHTQTKLLKERGLHDAYLEALPRQTSVALMQSLGVLVDQAEVKRNQAKLGKEIAAIEAEIDALPVVREYKADHREVNFAAGPDALNIFKDYLKRSEVLVNPEKHEVHNYNIASKAKRRFDEEPVKAKYSVDKNVLDKIDHPLANLIVDLRNRTKLKSTYCDGLERGKGILVYPDGKLHCNFNTTFAETGRTSSDDPNMQNFPQRNDAWIRRQIVAPKGHVLVAFDYGQLEGCTAAMCSKDKVLVKALWEDYDIHQEWAEKFTAKYPAAGPPDRSRIKNKLVFPAIFGAQNKSIAGYLGAPEDVIDDLMDEFWETFDGLAAWQDTLMQHYYEHGWVASPTGRRHHYPLTRNQAINHPVQSFACDIVCDAMNELSAMAVETDQWHLHPVLNIHDDLTFVIPDNDEILEEAITTIYKVMLTPPYKEVNVPLSVKASIGPAWYSMQEIGKFWSNRDV
jgi:uracil-DNA glycosylase family 4